MSVGIDNQSFNKFLDSFGAFVADEKKVDDSTIARTNGLQLEGVQSLRAGKWDFRGNLFRTAAQKNANNQVREVFKDAVSAIFKGEDNIPASVKAAMKWDDFDNKGRPLTARRIRATMNAINDHKMSVALNALFPFDKIKLPDERKREGYRKYALDLKQAFIDEAHATFLSFSGSVKTPDKSSMRSFLESITHKKRQIRDNVAGDLPDSTVEGIQKTESEIVHYAFVKAVADDAKLRQLFCGNTELSGTTLRNLQECLEDFSANIEKEGFGGVDDGAHSMAQALESEFSNVRCCYVLAMTKDAAIDELIRLGSADSVTKSATMNGIGISNVVNFLRAQNTPESKGILEGYFKKLGEQVLNGSLRNVITTSNDHLYTFVLRDDFENRYKECAQNRVRNLLSGTNTNQPVTVMDSEERDHELAKALATLKNGTSTGSLTDYAAENQIQLAYCSPARLDKLNLYPGLKTAARNDEALTSFIANVLAPPPKSQHILNKGLNLDSAGYLERLRGEINAQFKKFLPNHAEVSREIKADCVNLMTEMFFLNNPHVKTDVLSDKDIANLKSEFVQKMND